MEPKDYKHIWAHGKVMGSYDYYILARQEEAAEAGAPLNAVYERDGHWFTVDDRNTSPQYKAEIERLVTRYPGEVIVPDEEEEEI